MLLFTDPTLTPFVVIHQYFSLRYTPSTRGARRLCFYRITHMFLCPTCQNHIELLTLKTFAHNDLYFDTDDSLTNHIVMHWLCLLHFPTAFTEDNKLTITVYSNDIWGLWHLKQEPKAWISNYISWNSEMELLIPASGTEVLMYRRFVLFIGVVILCVRREFVWYIHRSSWLLQHPWCNLKTCGQNRPIPNTQTHQRGNANMIIGMLCSSAIPPFIHLSLCYLSPGETTLPP